MIPDTSKTQSRGPTNDCDADKNDQHQDDSSSTTEGDIAHEQYVFQRSCTGSMEAQMTSQYVEEIKKYPNKKSGI